MTAELGDRLAQELVAVVARAGKLGIPLVRLSELVEVSGKKLVRATCKELGYGSLRSFVDRHPEVKGRVHVIGELNDMTCVFGPAPVEQNVTGGASAASGGAPQPVVHHQQLQQLLQQQQQQLAQHQHLQHQHQQQPIGHMPQSVGMPQQASMLSYAPMPSPQPHHGPGNLPQQQQLQHQQQQQQQQQQLPIGPLPGLASLPAPHNAQVQQQHLQHDLSSPPTASGPSQPPSSHMHQFPSSAAPASSSSMPSSQGQHAQGLSGQLGSYALPPDMAQRAMVTSRPANKPPARCANGVQAAVLALRADRGLSEGAALIAEQRTASVAHWGLLGIEHHEKTRVFMATQAPFVAIATGRPGSGKTNTVGVLIENCLLDCDGVTENSLPMTTLIMHYDSDTSSCCELASLTQPNGRVQDVLGVAVPKVVVLVPPHLLAERTRDYSGVANVQVSPLLLDWNLLTAAQLTTLLGDVSAERSALLHAAVLAVMVEFEQEPISRTDYLAFKHQVARKYSQLPGTSAHVLQMQLTRLDDIIWQSEPNLTYARVQNESTFDKMLKDQPVVVADLSSTLYSPEDAGCLFAVMLQQFRSLNTSTRKLVVFDDVHRYATSDSTGAADCPLSMELVETCQRMHQANIRVIAASQRPHKLPTDIFSAANLVVVHRCQGQPSWGATLQQRLLLGPGGCDLLPQLQRGEAMVFASDSDEALESIVQGPWYKMRIRQRLTAGREPAIGSPRNGSAAAAVTAAADAAAAVFAQAAKDAAGAGEGHPTKRQRTNDA